MKKSVLLSFFVCILVLCSCSTTNSSISSYTLEDGTVVRESESGTDYTCKALPFDIPYNDTFVTFESIEYYEEVVDYSHHLYCVITLDVSQLDDEQLHWLTKSDLNISGALFHEKNQYDVFLRDTGLTSSYALIETIDHDTYLCFMSSRIDSKNKLICLFTSDFSEENRYSFSGADFNVTIEIAQEETYIYTYSDGEASALPKTNEARFFTVVPDEIAAYSTMSRDNRYAYSIVSKVIDNYK